MRSELSNFNQRLFLIFLFALGTAVYLLGIINIDLMDYDATQYACISREVFQTGEYLKIKSHGYDYLDKPPFLFWLSALSYKLFGISQFSYRLPTLLFILLGIYSTYKLASLLYNKITGITAAIILYTCQGYFLFSHDVRTDCILTNSVIFSVWQLFMFVQNEKIKHLILGFLGVSIAMMTKGPIGLLVPAFAIGSYLLGKREYKKIPDVRWLIGLMIVFICLLPMSAGLYQQFNTHGLKFYFWIQSFGRITGESKWKNNTDIFFFLHTFLWSFIPWSLLAVVALARNLADLVKNKFHSKREQLTTGGFVLVFIALSLSAYKLPHYIFIAFPFAAIFTADFITSTFISGKQQKLSAILWRIQVVVCCVLFLTSVLILVMVFPTNSLLIWLIFSLLTVVTLYFGFSNLFRKYRLVIVSALAIINTNFILNIHFYPSLLNYQPGSMAGKYFRELPGNNTKLYTSLIWDHSVDFYSGVNAQSLYDFGELNTRLEQEKEIWIYTSKVGLTAIQNANYHIVFMKTFDGIRVTGISAKFLNPLSRSKSFQQNYLIKVKYRGL